MNTYKIYKCELSEIQQIRLLKIIRNAQAKVLLCGYKAEKRIDLYDAYLLPYGWKCCKLIKYATTASDGKRYMAEHYNLDVIISVSYRVKSKRGIEFRRWANCVLREYRIKGYAVNHNRMNQLKEVIRVMKRAENRLDPKQVLTVVERYSQALELLDAYDHQNMERPKGNKATYILTYEECRKVIDYMIFPNQTYDSTQRTYPFLAKASLGVVVAINADEYEAGQSEKEIEHIEEYHKSGTVQIAETYNRFEKNGLRGLHIPADVPIEYLIYDSFMNPYQMHISMGEAGKKERKNRESLFGFGSDAALYFTWRNQGQRMISIDFQSAPIITGEAILPLRWLCQLSLYGLAT